MNFLKRTSGHKGYGKPGRFSASSTAHRFSNRRLLLVLTLAFMGVYLLVWGLFFLQGR